MKTFQIPTQKHLSNLPVYQPGRPIEEVARELNMPFDDIIKLASNENPLGPSPHALEAIQQAAKQAHLYPDGNAFYLKQRMADYLNIPQESIVFGNGSNELIEWIGHLLLDEHSNIVASQYCFAIYPIVAAMFGAQSKIVPALNFGHDLNAMADAIDDQTKAVFIANPNNPTGTLAPSEEVMTFLNRVPDHVLIVMDEAYYEFLPEPTDLLPLIREKSKPNLLIMRTFSKIHGLAGLRIGYGIGHTDLIQIMEKVRQPFNVNAMAQAGALAALEDENHVKQTRAINQRGIEFYQNQFDDLGIEYVPSFANFILAKVGDGKHVFEALQRLGVITRPMAGYQLPDWIRISIGTQQENDQCMSALKQVLKL